MAIIKSTFRRWNGTDWDEYWFKTSADIIEQTENFKVLTAAERTKISTYLTDFNGENLLLKLNGDGLVPTANIPDLSGTYLKVASPTYAGVMTGNAHYSTTNADLVLEKRGTSNQGGKITLSGDGITLQNNSAQASEITFEEGSGSDDGVLNFHGTNKVTGLKAPVDTSDAATKAYVDAMSGEGVRPIDSVKAATTENITISGEQTIDGVSLVIDDRVLVKNQTTVEQNGIYIVASGAWSKQSEGMKGALVFVENGSVNNDSKWFADSNTSWVKFSQTDSYNAGAGITKTGTTFSISANAITNTMLAGSINVSKLANFTSIDSGTSFDAWTDLTSATTTNGVGAKLNNLFAAITLLRGTLNYNTNNTETISGAYDLAEVKNRTYTTDPGVGNRVTGDLFFEVIA